MRLGAEKGLAKYADAPASKAASRVASDENPVTTMAGWRATAPSRPG
jgi:hypothetical protein